MDSMANEINKEKQKDMINQDSFNGYVCVIVSTLNQMVNYIPIKYFGFNEIYIITTKHEDGADNTKWDKNLTESFEKEINITPIGFHKNSFFDFAQIKNRLTNELKKGKLQNKKIFWNITGGQRHILLAINEAIKEQNRNDDVMCYLEGNKNTMTFIYKDEESKTLSDYELDNLTIETALKLMNFNAKDTKTSHDNLITCKTEVFLKEKEFYLKFFDKYIEFSKNPEIKHKMLENFIKLNTNYSEAEKKERVKAIKYLKDRFKDINQEILEKELTQNQNETKNIKSFGYILEKLAGYKIYELVEKSVADMSFSLKINFLDKNDEGCIDEFDIALLTKNGKFIIFECKSGAMSGDVAKSTKYSTYAISGVYGKPILITPFANYNDEDIKNKNFDNLDSTIKAAKRATLEVCGLDEIEEKIKKYIPKDKK